MLDNLEQYMIPCLNKKLFGFDCLGCGFQRASIHLIKGNFADAFYLYPAIYPLLLLCCYFIVNKFIKFKHHRKITLALISINILTIVISYGIKMSLH